MHASPCLVLPSVLKESQTATTGIGHLGGSHSMWCLLGEYSLPSLRGHNQGPTFIEKTWAPYSVRTPCGGEGQARLITGLQTLFNLSPLEAGAHKNNPRFLFLFSILKFLLGTIL